MWWGEVFVISDCLVLLLHLYISVITMITVNLMMMYPAGSEGIHENIMTLLNHMPNAEVNWQMLVLQILVKIGEKNPQASMVIEVRIINCIPIGRY